MRTWTLLGAIFALLGVAIGAFGTHGLSDILEQNNRVDTFNTASQYHLFHAIALFIVAWLTDKAPHTWLTWAGRFFVIGICLFSGSLYLLAIINIGFLGAIAPIGGTAFILGWSLIAYVAWHYQEDNIKHG